jgi:hypothetical protein
MKPVKKIRKLRRKSIAQAIKLTLESLESHLVGTVKTGGGEKQGNPLFHAEAVRDYALIIMTLSSELYHLSRQDFDREYKAGRYRI